MLRNRLMTSESVKQRSPTRTADMITKRSIDLYAETMSRRLSNTCILVSHVTAPCIWTFRQCQPSPSAQNVRCQMWQHLHLFPSSNHPTLIISLIKDRRWRGNERLAGVTPSAPLLSAVYLRFVDRCYGWCLFYRCFLYASRCANRVECH